jgi:hypothetical protein
MVSFCGGQFLFSNSNLPIVSIPLRLVATPKRCPQCGNRKENQGSIVKRMQEEKIACHVMSQDSNASKS